MSGFEVVGVVASAATLAELSLKIYQNLSKFITEAGEADVAARDLQSRINRLHKTTDTVWSTLRYRAKQADAGQLAREEVEIWETIRESLNTCERSLQKFENALEGLSNGSESLGWLKKALLQLKMERKNPTIAKLETTVDTHLQMMQVSLACLQIIMHAKNHNEIGTYLERLDQTIVNGSSHLGVLRQEHQPPIEYDVQPPKRPPDFDTDSAIDFEYDRNEAQIMEKCIGAAIAVRSAYDPDADSVRLRRDSLDDGETPGDYLSEPRTRANRSSSGLPLVDPTPDFNDTTHREVLTALIERFILQVKKDISSHHYIQAERNHLQTIALLEELQGSYNVPFDDYDEMQKTLVDLYLKQGKFREAQEAIHSNLQGRVNPQATTFRPTPMIEPSPELARSGEYYHLLSLTNHEVYLREKQAKYLEAAERDAKRAFKCRRETAGVKDPVFLETVHLLVQVYEDQGKMVHANTYRSLYLQQPSISSATPSPLLDANAFPNSVRPISSGESGHSISISTHRDSSPVPIDLISAIIQGRDEAIEDLLQQGADVEMSRHGKSALQYAVDSGNEKAVRKLLNKGVEPNPSLHYAVRKGNWRMTSLLLDLDADIEAKDGEGLTPLLTAMQGTSVPVTLVLLDGRADVGARGQLGWTALHYAVYHGSGDVMGALLNPQYEADINAVCTAGKTALHYAAEYGKLDLAEILLEHGANVYIEDSGHRTCFHIAVQRRKYDVVKMLLSRGVRFQRDSLPQTSPEIRNLLDERGQPAAMLAPPKARRGSSATSSSRRTRERLSSFFRPRSN
ncbi:MAG: Ankyrin-2 [Geoglossum simile]|nr:MAG: Ankyrin-2 [Geoglossum simile]